MSMSFCGPQLQISPESIGSLRYESDKRRYAGMLLVFGVTAMFGSLANVASFITGEVGLKSTDASEPPFWSWFGNVCIAFMGSIGIVTGYFALVANQGHPLVTGFLICAIQLAWIPYITGMTANGRVAMNFGDTGKQGYFPFENVTQGDVSFGSAMGILSILGHGLAWIGSLSFMAFSLFSYQVGKMSDRSSGYFKGRMPLYCFALFIEGIVQLAMGSYIKSHFNADGPLAAPVTFPMYVIFWPEISIAVGLVQLLTSIYGFVRSFCKTSPTDNSFQVACVVTWLCMIILQLTVQISWAPAGTMAAMLPSLACVTFPLIYMPAFLDHMARNTPDTIDDAYYGLDMTGDEAGEDAPLTKSVEQVEASEEDEESPDDEHSENDEESPVLDASAVSEEEMA